MSLQVDINEELILKITGAELAVLVKGLGELQHKIAGPVESRLVEEVEKFRKKKIPDGK